MKPDKRNGITGWSCATKNAMGLIDALAPVGQIQIRVHLVYAFNNDESYKARLVDDGLLADITVKSVSSWILPLHYI